MKEAMQKGTEQLRLKPGESRTVRILTPLEEIISVYEHTEQFDGRWKTVTCLGKNDCPLCHAGKRPSFRSYLVVLDREDNRVKIFKASKKVGQTLVALVEEYGDLSDRDFRISRQGERLDTTYTFLPRDPRPFDISPYKEQIPNVEEMVQPLSREAILAMMDGQAEDSTEEEDSGFDLPF